VLRREWVAHRVDRRDQPKVAARNVGSDTAAHPHLLWNVDTTETTSLHVYSPPLAAVTYHDPTQHLYPSGAKSIERTTPVRSRRAEATSDPDRASPGHADSHGASSQRGEP
jgi:hypothetical protein